MLSISRLIQRHSTRNSRERHVTTNPLAVGVALAVSACLVVSGMPCDAYAVTAQEISDAKRELGERDDAAEQASEQVNQTNVKIAELDSQVAELETSVSDDVTNVRSQVKSTYKNGDSVSVTTAILDSDTFIGAVRGLTLATKAQDQSMSAIQEVNDKRATIEQSKAELQELVDQQTQQKEALEQKAKEASDYLDGLNDEMRRQLGITDDTSVPSDISSGTGEAWRDMILMVAYANLGGAYVWGGEAFKACDCSGLVLQCYKRIGVSLPHSSEMQAQWCDKPISQAVPGDIVYRYGHVGIYIGNGRTIEAHSPSRGIGYGSLSSFTRCGSPVD